MALGGAEVGVPGGQFSGFSGSAGDLLPGEILDRCVQRIAQRVDGRGEFEQQARVFADGEQADD